MGVKWLRILEFTQGVSVPDDSRGDSDLCIFLENIFVSSNTQNLRLERAFAKVCMQRRVLTVEAMQLYAASFAGVLHNELPKIVDPTDRILQESLINYFYRCLHPEYVREKISHFKFSTINQMFDNLWSIVPHLWSRRQTLHILSLAEKRKLHSSNSSLWVESELIR